LSNLDARKLRFIHALQVDQIAPIIQYRDDHGEFILDGFTSAAAAICLATASVSVFLSASWRNGAGHQRDRKQEPRILRA